VQNFSVATQVLEQWGAKVTPIKTSEKKETDWLAEFGPYQLLIEEKIKFEDPEVKQDRVARLNKYEVHGTTQSLSHNNRISGIIGTAVRQLASTGSAIQHNHRIIWFTGLDFDAEAKHYQFISTLYGSTRVFELNKPKGKECYFFRNSDFFRYQNHIDGAVAGFLVGDELTIKLCLNPYSPGWQTLRDSPFAANFKVGLIDPVAEESAGKAYIADTELPRSSTSAVIRYLEEKYGLDQVFNIDMSLASAVVSIPRNTQA